MDHIDPNSLNTTVYEHRWLVWEKGNNECWYCQAPLTFQTMHIDHVIPRCQDGPDSLQNLVPACRPCNNSKLGRTPDQWQQALKRAPARRAGRRASKPYSLRLPEGLFAAFIQATKAEHRTINGQLALLIERWLAERHQAPTPPAGASPRP